MLNRENHARGELYPTMTDAERVNASAATGNLHWVGSEVAAAGASLATGRHAPSGHAEVYAPNPQRPGSSVSHFSTSLDPNELTEPFFTGVDHGPGLARDLMADLGWTTAAGDIVADLSGDRASDILWRNSANGNTIWRIIALGKDSQGVIGTPSTAWQVICVADYDRAAANILWRNTGTGNTVIWQMNGFAKQATGSIGAPSSAW
jgi:hypothetical protein